MGLFSKKPVLPDYSGMPVKERLEDPAWYDVVSRVPGFSNATLVTNADNGHIMNAGSLTSVDAGILTITPERVGYAYADKHEISQITQPLHKAEPGNNGDMVVINFGSPMNTWMFSTDDHSPYREAFRRARS